MGEAAGLVAMGEAAGLVAMGEGACLATMGEAGFFRTGEAGFVGRGFTVATDLVSGWGELGCSGLVMAATLLLEESADAIASETENVSKFVNNMYAENDTHIFIYLLINFLDL